ncbi:MAG: proline dehydrogenase family protein, partial [Candidatus Hodarchaeota archaeon]
TKNRIRLVIGIYKEPPSIALQSKLEMKWRIVKFTEKLVDTGNYVEVATHDMKTIHEVFNLIDRKKYSPDQIEFQMLLGVLRDKTQNEIQEKGFKIRLYVPFAISWNDGIAYLKRRMLENPQIILYVLQNLSKSRKIQTLITASVILLAILTAYIQIL